MRVVFGGNYPGTTQLQFSPLQIIIHHGHLGKCCHMSPLMWFTSGSAIGNTDYLENLCSISV